MRRSKLRSWGLALAVLFGGAFVRAQPPASVPPPGVSLPAIEQPKTGSTLQPVVAPGALIEPAPPPRPVPIIGATPTPTPGPAPAWPPPNSHAPGSTGHGGEGHGNGHGEGHGNGHGENAHEEEDSNKIFLSGEYLLLRPRRREQDYALVGANPNWAPVGVIKNVDGGFDSGYRLGAGYHLCGGLEAIVQYTYFQTGGDDQLPLGEVQKAGLQVFPTLTHPAVVGEVTAAQASNALYLHTLDLELGNRWKQGERITYRAYGGVRYVNLLQSTDALYTGGDVGPGGFDVVQRRLNINMAGLRAGGEVNYQFWEFMGVYARGSGSMVVGQFRSQTKEVANGSVIVDVSEKFDKLVPIVEAGIGVSFTHSTFRLTAGYEMWNYFGGYEAIDFGDDAHPAKPNRRWADLGFDGFAVRAEFLF